MYKKNFNRREFIKKSAVGFLGLTAFNMISPMARKAAYAFENSGVEYRILGRTGLKVSSVGFGAMKMTDNSVLKRAFDLGVNYVDTADCYQGGNNEIKVGEAIKGKRKDVIVVTKVHPASEAAMMRSLDTSLSRLNVDYIDVMQLHNAAPKQISNPEVIRILTKMKDSGKIRFIGTSSHGDIEGCIYAAIKAQVYDMVLVSYNFESPQTVTDAIAKTAESGVGVVAMKTQAGGYKTTENITPHQAMLKWVLQNKNVATTIPGVVSISQIEEFFDVMGMKMGSSDWKNLNKYGQAIDSIYCRMCNTCNGKCPKKVQIQDIFRALMYAQGYKDMQLAKSTYDNINNQQNASVCTDCNICSVKCKYSLPIKEKLAKAHSLFC